MQYFMLFISMVFLSISGIQIAHSRGISVLDDGGIKEQVRMVTATGRAIIQHQDALEEARMLALEDALYYAALQGGAKIEGFSSIDTATALTDMTVVKPITQILDYTVIGEIADETHYELTIEAMVGDRQKSGCQRRAISHLTLFKPFMAVDPALPGYFSQAPMHMSHVITEALSADANLRMMDIRHLSQQEAGASKASSTIDYRALTTGRARMYNGDFGVNSSISLRAEKQSDAFLTNEYAKLDISSEIFVYGERGVLKQVTDTSRIFLGKKSLSRTLSILTKTNRETLHKLVTQASRKHARKLSNIMRCAPLETKLEPAKAGLLIKRGTRQGVKPKQLAFAQGSDTPLTVLHVTDVSETTAILMPLDSRHDLASLHGATVTFQEFD
jgi:hypothetical protein